MEKLSRYISAIPHWLKALGVFTLFTSVIFYPFIVHPASVSSLGGEEELISFILNWDLYALLNKPLQLFNAPFFHPLKNTLAYSDLMLPAALLVSPLVLISKEPFIAFTGNLILSFILNGFFTYLFIRVLTKKFWPSIVAGTLFSFSIARIDTIGHLQILLSYWIPLGLLFLHRFLQTNKSKYAILFWIAFTLQITSTIFLGYIFIFFSVIWFFAHISQDKLEKIKTLILTGAPFIVCVIAILLPFYRVSRQFDYTRSLKDIWGGSSYILEYLYPTKSSRLEPIAQAILPKQPWPTYMGAAISVLGVASIAWFLKNKKQIKVDTYRHQLAVFIMAFTAFILSLGPYFQIKKHVHFPLFPIPLPYLALFHAIPGFKSMRTPQRWNQALVFALSLLIGLVLSRVWAKLKLKKVYKVSLAIIIMALVLAEISFPFQTRTITTRGELPEVYQWLSTKPPGVVLELPVQTWDMPLSSLEIERLHYHSFIFESGHTWVNGYSGFTPPNWRQSILELQNIGKNGSNVNDLTFSTNDFPQVDYLIVHSNELDLLQNVQIARGEAQSLSPFQLEEYFQDQPNIERIYQSDCADVYQLMY